MLKRDLLHALAPFSDDCEILIAYLEDKNEGTCEFVVRYTPPREGNNFHGNGGVTLDLDLD